MNQNKGSSALHKEIRRMFTGPDGGLRFFPRPDISLVIMILGLAAYFWIARDYLQGLIAQGIFLGALITWSMRQIILKEVPFWSYMAWLGMVGGFLISIYTLYIIGTTFII